MKYYENLGWKKDEIFDAITSISVFNREAVITNSIEKAIFLTFKNEYALSIELTMPEEGKKALIVLLRMFHKEREEYELCNTGFSDGILSVSGEFNQRIILSSIQTVASLKEIK